MTKALLATHENISSEIKVCLPLIGRQRTTLSSAIRLFAHRLEAQIGMPNDPGLTPLVGLFGLLRVKCSQRGLDAQRLQAIDHLRRHDTINAHTTERNAAVSRHSRERSAADIALRCSARAAIRNGKLLAALPAAKKTGEQRLATTDVSGGSPSNLQLCWGSLASFRLRYRRSGVDSFRTVAMRYSRRDAP